MKVQHQKHIDIILPKPNAYMIQHLQIQNDTRLESRNGNRDLVSTVSSHNNLPKTMSSSEKHDQLKEKHKQHTNNECSESSETCASAKCEPINNNLDNDIQIELVEEKDAAGVLKLLKDYFFKDEPMNTYLNLGECKELEDWSLSCIPEKCSFKAVNSNGEVVGVFLNGIVEKKPKADHQHCSSSKECNHQKFKKILALLEFVDTQFNLFEIYPDIDRYLDGKFLSVNSNYRGQGIAGKLLQRTMDYMLEHNIPIMSVVCSSYYSARVCEKLDYKEVYQLRYADYVVDGENPLLPAEPHTSVKALVKRVE